MGTPREGWRRARLETVLDLSLALAGPREEGDVIEELVHRAVGLLDGRGGLAVSIRSPLQPVAMASVGWETDLARVARLLAAPALQSLRAGEVARVAGTQLEVPFAEVLAAPCLWRDELVGVVLVADREGRAGVVSFDSEDATFLRSLALLAAPAIASGRALALEQRQRLALEEENRTLRSGAGDEENLIGQAPSFRRVIELARRVAATDVTVLLRGESGTGKERLARLLHQASARHAGPFVALNCAAVPETLLEAELFGIERGVATGVSGRVGKIELAAGGTLFLDEVGDLSLPLQAKFLRVVQEREVERVGGRQLVRVDVRLVTATNRDLEGMMRRGEFREDLYYRLRVVELTLPTLRDRREDIGLLALHFARGYGRRGNRPPLRFSRAAMEVLLQHDFPGNVRELENLVEAAGALAAGPQIEAEDLRLALRGGSGEPLAGVTLDDAVRHHVLRTLQRLQGNRGEAARALGVDRSTLYRMLMRWNASSDAQRTMPPQSSMRKRS